MNKETKYIFPDEALLKFRKEDVGTTLFCNSFYNGKKYGGLLLVCDNTLLKKLNVEANHSNSYAPEFAFRMFSDKQFFFTDYLFEFDVRFNGAKEATKLHLHQDSKSFRDFCKNTIKHRAFGILFQNVDTGLLNATYLHLQDDEDLDWLERNFEVSKDAMSSSVLNKFKQWDELSKRVQEQNKETSTYFLQNERVAFLDVTREKSDLNNNSQL
nr:hypothetical protein [uncultured Flavobacterium sp.]